MRAIVTLLISCLATLPGCREAGQPSAARPAPPAAAEYPMCKGQRLPAGTVPPRTGPVDVQLAAAFLDEMTACRAESGIDPRQGLIARAGEGTINAKGDCEYASVGITCHYHSGVEFVTTSTTQQTPGMGELHCIFPGDAPKSPAVYGGHVVCRGAKEGQHQGGHALAHDVHQGAHCPAELLSQLRSCKAFRCCDDGTLTNPIADLVHDGRNDLRPDFRICDQTIEIDCALLAELTPHEANCPALGGIGEPVFDPR